MDLSRKKLIIDTDPGIDDAMAILVAFNSPEVEIIGLTTIFGNVPTSMATSNALRLLEVVGRGDVPVAQGSSKSLKEVPKQRIADFVHGSDGLGNISCLLPAGKAICQTAMEFLLEKANQYPGEVTIVTLGPLTNIAMAIEADPNFAKKIRQIVILGGAFYVNGNVNPAAEANIFGDPDAADIVFTSGAEILVIGINITHQVVMRDQDLTSLGQCDSKSAQFVCKIAKFYFAYHHEAYRISGVYLHDPTAMMAAIDPSLFTYVGGSIRVQSEGICKGLTIFHNTSKRFGEISEWCNKPTVKVAVTVDADRVRDMINARLMAQ